MVKAGRSFALIALGGFVQVTTSLQQQRSFLDAGGGRCRDRGIPSSGGCDRASSIFRRPMRTSKSVATGTSSNENKGESSSSSSPVNSKEVASTKASPLRLQTLALHGSGGRALDFAQGTLQKWKENLLASTCASFTTANSNGTVDDNNDSTPSSTTTSTSRIFDLDVTTVQGLIPKEDGFAWWFLPPGVRSSTSATYEGFDESCRLVMDALERQAAAVANEEGDRVSSSFSSTFDLIVGQSQGAILLTALLALGQLEGHYHPTVGYILNGVAWPNPYTKQLESLKIATTTGDNCPPRVLVIVGERDAMNPPEQGERVAKALQQAGYNVTTLYHPGGHAVPVQRDETWDSIAAWIVEGALAGVTD